MKDNILQNVQIDKNMLFELHDEKYLNRPIGIKEKLIKNSLTNICFDFDIFLCEIITPENNIYDTSTIFALKYKSVYVCYSYDDFTYFILSNHRELLEKRFFYLYGLSNGNVMIKFNKDFSFELPLSEANILCEIADKLYNIIKDKKKEL